MANGMQAWRLVCVLGLGLGLSGCLFNHGSNLPRAEAALAYSAQNPLQPDDFTLCRDHGCATERKVSLTPTEWAEITAPLRVAAADARSERAQVARSVSRFELAVGPKAGTAGDVGGTLTGFGEGGQQDCVDEAVTTTRFLLMLEKDRLLRHHVVSTPVHRAWIPGEITHLTATVVELEGGRGRYAIDSWFHGNGHLAEVVGIEAWLEGWEPPVWRFRATNERSDLQKLASDGDERLSSQSR
ncbi:MAG: hypothetical protein QNJ30_17435 [Kiloniellales bacterium]|nr:hypothetical protein [Kiloniellales bacterium]